MTDTIGALAGAVLVCGAEGSDLTAAERAFFREVQPAGVTLFRWNVRPDEQEHIAELVRSIQATRNTGAPPLVIAIDQEGGRVARLQAPFPNPGPAQALAAGRHDTAALNAIRDIAEDQARRLRALGINVNFAPVVDVLTEPTNTAIGDRAFGTDPESVCLRAGAYLEGMSRAGILGCLKHFPGQGAAKVDTHVGRALVDVTRATLQARELHPFASLLKSPGAASAMNVELQGTFGAQRVPMIMISHCIYPAIDGKHEASRSVAVIQNLLRGELGYRGVVVSDDMNMGAMPDDELAWAQAIVEAVAAGVDMILVCRHLEKFKLAHKALAAEGRRSPAFAQRLTEAAGRVANLRRQLIPLAT